MLRVFSPIGFDLIFTHNTRLLHASFSPKNGGLTITLIMHISAGQEHATTILVKSPTHLYWGFSFYNISGIKINS
jgi:hypothetical protein